MKNPFHSLNALVAVLLTVSLAACGGEDDDSSAGTAGARPATPAVVGPNDVDADVPAPADAPTWDEQARTAALERAAAAVRAYARPGLDADRWWEELAPLLTPAARVAYEFTDPAEVPASRVTGRPRLVDDDSPYLAGVLVPTDVGAYRVLLARAGDGQPWLVERITPPVSSRRP